MRNDKKADWLFALSAAGLVLAMVINHRYETQGTEVFYFFMQSAFIGSAADWFAVTALFRKPLGIPFHTAIIPKHRDRLIAASRYALQEKILEPEIWDRLAEEFPLKNMLESLGIQNREELSRKLTEWALDKGGEMLPSLLESKGKEEYIEKAADECVAVLAEGISHVSLSPLIDSGLRYAEFWLNKEDTADLITFRLKDAVYSRISAGSRFMMSLGEMVGAVDFREVADSLIQALIQIIEDMEAGNDDRKYLEAQLSILLSELVYGDSFYSYMARFMRKAIEDAVNDNDVRCVTVETVRNIISSESFRKEIEEMIFKTGTACIENKAILGNLSDKMIQLSRAVFLYEHQFIGDMVEKVMSSFSDKRFNDFIYSKVSEELGWIRINGAITGAFAGVTGYILFSLLGSM